MAKGGTHSGSRAGSTSKPKNKVEKKDAKAADKKNNEANPKPATGSTQGQGGKIDGKKDAGKK